MEIKYTSHEQEHATESRMQTLSHSVIAVKANTVREDARWRTL